jgi:hypothetical protein
MANIRKIKRHPNPHKNYFVVDACFLVNKYIPPTRAPDSKERQRIERCLAWWEEIDVQLEKNRAKVYVPDLCIAESFKTLAKKYFQVGWFTTPAQLNNARTKIREDITISSKRLRSANRHIKYHDLSTSRDIIIAVDRFYELFMKHRKSVQLVDLIVVATAKYLIDFYDIQKSQLHIVTLDRPLWEGTKKIPELPNAYDPTMPSDLAERVFE